MKNLNLSGYTVAKLYINQIAMSIFGVMVIMAASSQSDLLIFLASLLSIGLYLYIIYSMMWDEGAKVAAKTLRAEDSGARKILTPFLTVLFGSMFNIICAVIYAVIKIYAVAENITEGTIIFAGNMVMVIIKFTNAVYMGFDALLFPVDQAVSRDMLTPPYYFFLTMIPLFAVGITAYYLGASEISIMKRLGFNIKLKNK